MKNLFFAISLVLSSLASASVKTVMIQGTVRSFDLKTVTLEILGEKYKLNREKLGADFKKLKAGDIFSIEVDQKFLKK